MTKNQRTCHLVGFAVLSNKRVKNERKRKDTQIPGPCQRTEKAVEHSHDSVTNRTWHTWNIPT